MDGEGSKKTVKARKSNKSRSKKSKRSKQAKDKTQKVEISKKLDSPKEVSLDDFKILKKLGDGAQGSVYMVEKIDGIDEGKIYALKVYDKTKVIDCEVALECLSNERKILEKIQDDPFLATMIYAFQNEVSMFIVLEFAQGGEFFQIIKSYPNGFGVAQARFYVAEVILAMELLHKKNILYRDLKLENILLDAQGHVLLTDFGLSIDLNEVYPESGGKLAGTAEYVSPECLDDDLPFGLSSDWWCVGILTHELITGLSPFSNGIDEKEEIYEKILHEHPNLHDELKGAPLDFIISLLQKNASDRLGSKNGARDLKEHSWFEGIDWNLLYQKVYPVPFVCKFNDKYDVQQFDDHFTSTSLDSFNNSTEEGEEVIEDFSFVSSSLTNKEPKKISKYIAITKEKMQNLKLIFNEHAKLIGKKMPMLYVDNKHRPSMIEVLKIYKK